MQAQVEKSGEEMKLLAVVANSAEVPAMRRLLVQAGYQNNSVWVVNDVGFEGKPSMKQLRELKLVLDKCLEEFGPFDYIVAAGDTAARLVLDTANVNINKLRGRDFKYTCGVKALGKKKKECEPESHTE